MGWHWMLEAMEGSFNEPRHGDVIGALGIIPGEGEAQIFLPFQSRGVTEYRSCSADNKLLTKVCDAKIIHNKGEEDWKRS
jgi:hypothetical protein